MIGEEHHLDRQTGAGRPWLRPQGALRSDSLLGVNGPSYVVFKRRDTGIPRCPPICGPAAPGLEKVLIPERTLDAVAAFDPSPRSEVSETVRELVWVLLKSSNCSAERVAKHLGVDRRTIQSYSLILDAARRDMVTSFVEKGQRPLNEVALMLGFSGFERIFPLV